MKICGFEMELHHWHGKDMPRWKIDHCNNRSGNSLIGEVIKDSLGDELKTLIKGFDVLDAASIKQLKESARDEYLSVYKRTLINEARSLAEEHAKKFIKSQIDIALHGDAEKIKLLMMEGE